MDEQRIYLKRSRCYAYVKLIDTGSASLYVPGLIDTIVHRSAEGLWYVDPMVINAANYNKSFYANKILDPKDIYAEDNDSVESILNKRVFTVVNEAMFDES